MTLTSKPRPSVFLMAKSVHTIRFSSAEEASSAPLSCFDPWPFVVCYPFYSEEETVSTFSIGSLLESKHNEDPGDRSSIGMNNPGFAGSAGAQIFASGDRHLAWRSG
ncbi:hypothetical protein [Rhizobium sp. YS-1r]|uniref:hypothetical protein n=1 Tax=Rhizobium sp. YS-1r TaxID=1532558 RepID=UPI0005106A86|nr:hypothetical protein [Rhizobium sp. YS-1r]KGD85824.1 hypothetical protein JL39_26860 [Rhizobium sp. YS-1r]